MCQNGPSLPNASSIHPVCQLGLSANNVPSIAEEVAVEPAVAASLPVAKPDIPGMENGGRTKPKPKKDKKVKLAAVELPKLDDSTFVPPASVLKRYANPKPRRCLKSRYSVPDGVG